MGLATDIYGEGIRIPPIRLVRKGVLDADTMRLLLANVRGNVERRGDFDAQIGSLKTGAADCWRLSSGVAKARRPSTPRN